MFSKSCVESCGGEGGWGGEKWWGGGGGDAGVSGFFTLSKLMSAREKKERNKR